MKKSLYFIMFIAVSFAYGQDFSGSINNYLNSNQEKLGLQTQDFADIKVNNHSFSESMDVENVYVIQRHQGIEIFNSTSSFAVKNGTVVYSAISFSENIAQKVNATNPGIAASMAVNKAAQELGLNSPSNLQLLETVGANSFVYSNGNVSSENIPVKLVYQKTEDNSLRLAWDLSIYTLDTKNYYSVRVDAISGAILETHDWIVSCNSEELSSLYKKSKESNSVLFSQEEKVNFSNGGGAQYRVFAMPIESPNHGSDALVADPSGDGDGSPFGWHDTNGAAGAEYTITRGNNVWSQDDINGNNGTGISADGGASLNFDFPYDFDNPPFDMIEASTVNLFYWNNIMHDVWYEYGFNEASGNFQENNYGNGGAGSDSVNADAQDGSGINNATFATPPDGSNPRMSMHLFDINIGTLIPLTINNGPLAGDYSGANAAFGTPLNETPITADLVLVEDDDSGDSTDPNDACDPITNGGALTGKIAVIRRGECEFGFKVLAAENEGAIAVIIVNNAPGAPVVMGPGVVGDSVTIPSIMLSQADGEAIIAELGGAAVNGSLSDDRILRDGDLDNGIVAHEYGHGVSNRLTGGPNAAGCLQNDEQMGEGWSDWIGFMLTIEPGDQGEDARGQGTYAFGQPITGGGIRSAPYSTDFAVNDFTYGDLPGQQIPHEVGFVWATMIWDLSWALIDEYGFDADIYNGTGGNNMAMQLVIDGMKLQGCSPGFVDGRDAILEADEIANGGANRCLIWEVFARRGLGEGADQGSTFNSTDGTENFDIPTGPDCILANADSGSIENNFYIYPNPSNGNINIRSLRDFGDASISIFDINGRKVFDKNVTLYDTVNINAEHLTTGIYLIQIDGVTYSHTAKLIIN